MTSAALLLHPDHLAVGRSAAVLHGLPTLKIPSSAELVSRDDDTTGRRQGGHIRTTPLRGGAVTTWYGVPVLGVAETVVYLARFDRRDGLIAADAALRERMLSLPSLGAAIRDAAGLPGIRQARDVLAIASPQSESPLESLVRLELHDDGFPEPELQAWLETGRGRYRVDMLFRRERLVVESDGLAKYTDIEWRREKRREAALRACGYRVERVIWDDVMNHWPATRARLWVALGGA